ncbi:MAG TPA: hypothetical protein VGN97_01585 [Mesorhizobium sp.]|jgi:hypothetical protein|nr:hypothetical protein [Mesorhizobium sp.]
MIALIAVLALFAEPAALKESMALALQAAPPPAAQGERHPRPRPSPERGGVLAELLGQS